VEEILFLIRTTLKTEESIFVLSILDCKLSRNWNWATPALSRTGRGVKINCFLTFPLKGSFTRSIKARVEKALKVNRYDKSYTKGPLLAV